MKFGQIREPARSSPQTMVLGSTNSQQSSQSASQSQKIYTRPDSGRSNASPRYENIPSSYGNNRQEPHYANPQESYYQNLSESAPPLPPRRDPNRSNQNQAVPFQIAGSRSFSEPAGAGYSPYRQNPNTSGSNGFTRQPPDFPQGANSLRQHIAEVLSYGSQSVPLSAFRAPPISNASHFHTIEQERQRFNEPSPAHSNSTIYPVVPYNPHQVVPYNAYQAQPYSSQQRPTYSAQQSPTYSAQQSPNYSSQQGPTHGSQQGQHYSSRPFSGPSEVKRYQDEVERLLSHPGRIEISVPFGTPMGMTMTQGHAVPHYGSLPSGAIEFNQVPVGVTTFATSPYVPQNAPSANAQPASPNQGTPQSPGNYSIITRL